MNTWRARAYAMAIAIGVVALLAPTRADAACTNASRSGTWKIYAMWTDNFDSGWTKCTGRINSSGGVRSGTTCQEKDAGSGSTTKANVQGGTIKLQSNCKINGNIKVGGCRNTITEGWISKDATMMSGVGRDCEGFVFQFNGIKR